MEEASERGLASKGIYLPLSTPLLAETQAPSARRWTAALLPISGEIGAERGSAILDGLRRSVRPTPAASSPAASFGRQQPLRNFLSSLEERLGVLTPSPREPRPSTPSALKNNEPLLLSQVFAAQGKLDSRIFLWTGAHAQRPTSDLIRFWRTRDTGIGTPHSSDVSAHA